MTDRNLTESELDKLKWKDWNLTNSELDRIFKILNLTNKKWHSWLKPELDKLSI
jgi:hypothetical protein